MYDPTKSLLEQSFFDGKEATPEKLRALKYAMYTNVANPSVSAFLSGCAIVYLEDFAKMLEEEERSYDAIKVTNGQ
jgi:hypothetical protein